MDSILFTPKSWAKLITLRDSVDTEISMMAVSAVDNPLKVVDLWIPKQLCSVASTEFEDDQNAAILNELVPRGIEPWQCSRIWCHTHPGESPNPSQTDENNFKKNYDRCSWAIMFIIARGGNTYARLKIQSQITAGTSEKPLAFPVKMDDIQLKVMVDWASSEAWSPDDVQSWRTEANEKVNKSEGFGFGFGFEGFDTHNRWPESYNYNKVNLFQPKETSKVMSDMDKILDESHEEIGNKHNLKIKKHTPTSDEIGVEIIDLAAEWIAVSWDDEKFEGEEAKEIVERLAVCLKDHLSHNHNSVLMIENAAFCCSQQDRDDCKEDILTALADAMEEELGISRTIKAKARKKGK